MHFEPITGREWGLCFAFSLLSLPGSSTGTWEHMSNPTRTNCITLNGSVALRPTKFETTFSNQILPAPVCFILTLVSSKELNWTTPIGFGIMLSALSSFSLLIFSVLFTLFNLSLSANLIDYPDFGKWCLWISTWLTGYSSQDTVSWRRCCNGFQCLKISPPFYPSHSPLHSSGLCYLSLWYRISSLCVFRLLLQTGFLILKEIASVQNNRGKCAAKE